MGECGSLLSRASQEEGRFLSSKRRKVELLFEEVYLPSISGYCFRSLSGGM
jgi:hypothetical protein